MVELLVVMGIMALMIGIAVPAINSMGRASAVSSGASQLAGMLALARAKAVTSRSHIRVIFPRSSWIVGPPTTTNVTMLPCVSYTVIQESVTYDISGHDSRLWRFVDSWHHLPKGAYFPAGGLSTLPTVNLFYASPTPTNDSVPYIEFKPTGAITSSGDVDIAIQEGTVVDGVVRNTNSINTITNRIYAFTGRVKVLR